MTEAVSLEQMRAEVIARGQVTEQSIAHACTEQDAYETSYHLAELRKQAGLTQNDVATALAISQARVSGLENGGLEHLTVASIRKYLAALEGSIK